MIAAVPPASAPPPRLLDRARRRLDPVRPYLSTIAFLAGSGYDLLTLRRIDQQFDNWLLLAYLLVLGLLLGLDRRIRRGRLGWPWLVAREEVLALFAQFLQGGLFSAYVIFYTKSASLWTSFFWLAPLVIIMLINEFRESWVQGERVRLLLFAFSSWSLLLFFLPVILHTGFLVTTLGALAGTFLLVAAVLTLGHAGTVPPTRLEGTWVPGESEERVSFHGSLRCGLRDVAVLLAALFVLDKTGVTPPVPLALLEAGIFHDVRREGDELVLRYEAGPAWNLLRKDDRPFRYREGDTVHCHSSVFAPTGLQLALFHRWERWDERPGRWVQTDRIAMTMVGGRALGWRGRSEKRRVDPGLWRVRVEREDGREIGRIRFEIEAAPAEGERRWLERRL